LQKNRKATDGQRRDRQPKNAVAATRAVLMFVFSHQKERTLISSQPVFKSTGQRLAAVFLSSRIISSD
jgi:hypothetical protein